MLRTSVSIMIGRPPRTNPAIETSTRSFEAAWTPITFAAAQMIVAFPASSRTRREREPKRVPGRRCSAHDRCEQRDGGTVIVTLQNR